MTEILLARRSLPCYNAYIRHIVDVLLFRLYGTHHLFERIDTMSASKKKQQRREAVDVEKVTEAQAKQAAYKKKARLYTIIGIVVAVLVVVLLVWNSGIFQKNATAATIGDDKLSVAELSFYYYDVRQMYAQYGMIDSSMNDAETVLNSAEGTTYQDYFLEQALSDAQRYHVLYEDALKEGRTAADVKDSVDAQIANLKASAKA